MPATDRAAAFGSTGAREEMEALLRAHSLGGLRGVLEEEELMDAALLRSFPDLRAALDELEVSESDAARLVAVLGVN